jgi:uncharacterized protein (DUF427 family)
MDISFVRTREAMQACNCQRQGQADYWSVESLGLVKNETLLILVFEKREPRIKPR